MGMRIRDFGFVLITGVDCRVVDVSRSWRMRWRAGMVVARAAADVVGCGRGTGWLSALTLRAARWTASGCRCSLSGPRVRVRAPAAGCARGREKSLGTKVPAAGAPKWRIVLSYQFKPF
jgi:hypothetical protein